MATEPEVLDREETAISLRDPRVPTTVNELAARKGEAVEIIQARVQVLETARLAAIRMTHPEDWVLYKTKDDRITGYLEDSGCERVRAIFGIKIFDVEEPEKLTSADGKSFAIVVRGRGSSGLTMDILDAVEGVRESTEDFCKDLTGVKQEIRVRQAARANLDGRIVRELAGLSSVPIEELTRAWAGTDKKVEHCRKGRGFGSQDERLGASKEGTPDVAPPECPICKIPLVYRAAKGNRAAFYGCRQYEQHPKSAKPVIVDAAVWVAEQKAKAAQPSQPQQPAAAKSSTSKPQQADLTASDIFGREPGAEG